MANNPHHLFAIKLIEQILETTKYNQFDIILDIGSGSGNVTQMLADWVKHRQIIGVDIDQKMIDISIQNNTKPSIAFIAEDMSKPWDELSAGLRALEGKVSLVFSNSTLMMIQNKSTLIHNLHRLMAHNSYVFISYVLTLDLNANLNKYERIECEKWIKVPKYDEQVSIWTQVFTKQGFIIERTEIRDYSYGYVITDSTKTVPKLESLYAKWCANGRTIDVMPRPLRERFKEQMCEQIFNCRQNRPKAESRSLYSVLLDLKAGDRIESVFKTAAIVVRKH